MNRRAWAIRKIEACRIVFLCSVLLLTGCGVDEELSNLVETAIETEIATVTEMTVTDDISYTLERISYTEESKIDLQLSKMTGENILWERIWKDLYLTELPPYSELVELDDRLYIEVYGMLYGVSTETGKDIFEAVRVGVGERPLIDEDGAIYCVGFYGPFATKIEADGTVSWTIDYLDDYYWPWDLRIEGNYAYIECSQMNETSINLLQVDKMSGIIGNAYWADRDSVIFEKVTASSTLTDYPVTHVLDDNKFTGWVEGKSGDGIGESIVFEHYKAQEISKMVISNGYHKSQELYKANNRVKDLEIHLSSSEVIKYRLADVMEAVEILFDERIVTDRVEIIIKSVYPGSTYSDTVITGIRFY